MDLPGSYHSGPTRFVPQWTYLVSTWLLCFMTYLVSTWLLCFMTYLVSTWLLCFMTYLVSTWLLCFMTSSTWQRCWASRAPGQ